MSSQAKAAPAAWSAPADLPIVEANGLFFLADPHLAATPPGQRLEGYGEQVMEKVRAGLARARELGMAVVVCGDLFHWPRENPNALLVAIIDLFRAHDVPCKPWVLVGNHDKYQARYTPDVSMAVLDAAGVIHLMAEPGPQFRLRVPAHAPGGPAEAVVGASPDMAPLPGAFARAEAEAVLWVTHHNIGFPDYEFKPIKPHEIPGVDWIVNGHIHRPQPMVITGGTRWVNAGGMVRLTFSRRAMERRPAARFWTPGCAELGTWDVPIQPFSEVFPDQDFPEEDAGGDRESLFLQGLERLAWRRTRQGEGLKQFLQDNLTQDTAAERLIWELYEEATHGEPNG
ncbi:MAG: exonuclease SbcCD subunit D [Desulfovibrionaceae bacterium]